MMVGFSQKTSQADESSLALLCVCSQEGCCAACFHPVILSLAFLFLGNRSWWQQESHHHLCSRSSAEVLPEDSGASGEGAGEEVQRKARGLHCTGEDGDGFWGGGRACLPACVLWTT